MKLKRTISLLLALALILSMAACGAVLNDEDAAAVEEIIASADLYLDGEVSGHDANDIVYPLADALYDSEEVEDQWDDMGDAAQACVLASNISVYLLADDYDRVLQYRNELAEIVGIDSY